MVTAIVAVVVLAAFADQALGTDTPAWDERGAAMALLGQFILLLLQAWNAVRARRPLPSGLRDG